MNRKYLIFCLVLMPLLAMSQLDSTTTYQKRILESIEIDFLSSYYEQSGENAAVTGGIGTEQLEDVTGTIVVAIPIKRDGVLKIDAGVSAYTSASSSNVNPFDQRSPANAFVASSGESKSDLWSNLTASYTHYSEDRDHIWSGKVSLSAEYDYTSIGVGGSYAHLFNRKNTELSISGSAYFDTWSRIYPAELGGSGGDDDEDFNLARYTITGNPNYNPNFTNLSNRGRNSYALGLGLSQILSRKLQGSVALDVIFQQGLLSTPFQRVYFADVEDSFVEEFHLADDIERLPDSRLKIAIGGRLNYYVNETVSLRSFHRFYADDWGITSLTTSLEVPIKVSGGFTIYPSYRFYEQSASKHFKEYNQHISTSTFYTSDFDLSQYNSNQWGFGVSYTDRFSKVKIGPVALKSIDLKYYRYDRNTSFSSSILTMGMKWKLGK